MIKQLKWYGESAIDPSWFAITPEDYCDYRQFILDRVDFAKVLYQLGLHPEDCSTGKYTHRMVCPFKFHKNGQERTGSFRFNNKKNTFVCFGCGENSNILHFLQVYIGGWEQLHLEKLAMMFGLIKDGQIQVPEGYVEQEITIQETNAPIIHSIGIMLRDYLLAVKGSPNYAKECEWCDDQLEKVDKHFLDVDEEDLEAAKSVYEKLEKAIERRKKTRG